MLGRKAANLSATPKQDAHDDLSITILTVPEDDLLVKPGSEHSCF